MLGSYLHTEISDFYVFVEMDLVMTGKRNLKNGFLLV
jgi:hypothetical protein